MVKPLISPVSEKETKITFKTTETISTELSEYMKYLKEMTGKLDTKKDAVISECLRYVFDRDKGFKDWKNQDKPMVIKASDKEATKEPEKEEIQEQSKKAS